jgi:antitoxin CptB
MHNLNARILWKCRRGLLELDLALKGFLHLHGELTNDLIDAFERVLALPDHILWEMIAARRSAQDPLEAKIIAKIRKSLQAKTQDD